MDFLLAISESIFSYTLFDKVGFTTAENASFGMHTRVQSLAAEAANLYTC